MSGASGLLGLSGQLLRFGGIGVLATLVHLSVAGLALHLSPGLSPFLANLMAFLVAFPVSFFGHGRVTFRSSGRPLRFMAASLVGFGFNNGGLLVLLQAGFLTDFQAIAVSTFLVPLFMYLVAKFWVFTGDGSAR